MFFSTRLVRFAIVLIGLSALPCWTLAADQCVEVAGVVVTPHVLAGSMQFRRAPSSEVSARVDVFLRNKSEQPVRLRSMTFNGRTAAELLEGQEWAWHDSGELLRDPHSTLAPGALAAFTYNGRKAAWGATSEVKLRLDTDRGEQTLLIPVKPPRVWVSTINGLGSDNSARPKTATVHIANQSSGRIRLKQAKLYGPRQAVAYRVWTLSDSSKQSDTWFFPESGVIDSENRGGLVINVQTLPLAHCGLEIVYEDAQGKAQSVWARWRNRKLTFDISGGWTADQTQGVQNLTFEPYLKTLKRLGVNAAQIDRVPGYTDQPQLYDRYPLKLFNRLIPTSDFDNDRWLNRVHAVEFLGEPQMRGKSYRSPQQVYEEFLPYAGGQMPTSVTLSDASSWRLYAGLSDFPHYDAYRVAAPMADSWSQYDRWDGLKIRWGAPLETIGDMCRSLRENSRPSPVAYWSQGPHAGWRGFAGRRRGSPTPDELRLQAYHGLASRIVSLYWFNLSLKSLVQYRDTLNELERVGREIRTLEPILLQADAFSHQTVRNADQKLDWELSVVSAPQASLLFAIDLNYAPDPQENVFKFAAPRRATFDFPLPNYAGNPQIVFRVDADGVYDVAFEKNAQGVQIRDQVSKTAVYVVSNDPKARIVMLDHIKTLRDQANAIGFDPARQDSDFNILRDFLNKDAGAKSKR